MEIGNSSIERRRAKSVGTQETGQWHKPIRHRPWPVLYLLVLLVPCFTLWGCEEEEEKKDDLDGESDKTDVSPELAAALDDEKASVVSVSMTLNVDYQQLSADDKVELKGKIRDVLAESANVDQAAVTVTLAPGSVKVDAEIQIPADNSAESIEKAMDKGKIEENVVEAANSIPGVKAAATGELKVTGLEVKTVEPATPAPTPTPSGSAPTPTPPGSAPTTAPTPAPPGSASTPGGAPAPTPPGISTPLPAPTPAGPAPPPLPRDKKADAQFLIQATFGPTRSSLAEVAETTYTSWIHEQMSMPVGSHRAYYRSRINSRLGTSKTGSSTLIGSPKSQCTKGSRWHNFAFTMTDRKRSVSVSGNKVLVNGVHRTDIDPSYSQNGLSAPSSCTDTKPKWYSASKTCGKVSGWQCQFGGTGWTDSKYCQQSCYDRGVGYDGDDCSSSWGEYTGYICGVQEEVGGWVGVSTDSDCKNVKGMANPGIWFASSTVKESSLAFEVLKPGVVLLKQTSPLCSLKSAEFMKYQGNVYRHDMRLDLLQNTLDNPASAVGETCPTVAKTFLNEKSCKMQPTCTPLYLVKTIFSLDKANLAKFHSVGGKYVYQVTGLRNPSSPCGRKSRWKKMDCSTETCTASSISNANKEAIATALEQQEGWLRDISVKCSGVPSGSIVKFDDSFWLHVHLHEHNVYDFSTWKDKHPGGENHIKKWATQGLFTLSFPSHHSMERWNAGSTQNVLQYVGKMNYEVNFQDLPTSLQTTKIANAFEASGSSGYFEACGSPNEVANEPKLGNHLSFYSHFIGGEDSFTDRNFDKPYRDKPHTRLTRFTVWVMQALKADDQLRQRIAWALSQIFVTGTPGYGNHQYSEFWINYYDIFIRNAFGNFRDVLREVTYSPLMGGYLTFDKNSAFDYNSNYPDENYAREIMQLFTIGLWKLNPDGSKVLDAAGHAIPTYNNEHIMNFARVFTGLMQQVGRANVEMVKGYQNLVDPMRMQSKRHDVYPKPDLNGNYLGDGYPLCSDLPSGAFLTKGAKYSFLGSEYGKSDFLTLSPESSLFNVLCAATVGSACQFQLNVELAAAVQCSGEECKMDAVRVVKVESGYYEYVPPTCVHLFFATGQIAAPAGRKFTWPKQQKCLNPSALVAGASCCGGCSNVANNWMKNEKRQYTCENSPEKWPKMLTKFCNNDANWAKNKKFCQLTCFQNGVGYDDLDCSAGAYKEERICSYPKELVSYHTAVKKCAQKGMKVCPDKTADAGNCQYDNTLVWKPTTCASQIAVDESGKISSQANDKTKVNKFAVAWVDGFPNVDACPSGCTTAPGECVCDALIEENKVFDQVPSKDQLQKLKIGALPPSAPCTSCDGEVKAYSARADDAIDKDTVFEHNGQFYKNAESIVRLGDYSFRNPPVFMLGGVKDERAALAEVESLLDHLFYHPNTAPFVSYRLIQRFTTSNPSKRYVQAVADAFRTGSYGGHEYSGKYGDLGATVSAILLDPEARSSNANSHGALREPLIKFIHFLRSMEYVDREDREIQLQSLEDVIGQTPYESPSVFNFYTPDYQPARFPTGTVGPEFQIFTSPFAIGFLNGMMSLIDHGLSACKEGFGKHGALDGSCKEGELTLPTSVSQEEALDLLNLLLTGGRLNTSGTVQAAFEKAKEGDQIKAAQQVIVMTPEFNAMGKSDIEGARPPKAAKTGPSVVKSYKAVVKLFMNGGADTFNMLVPFKCNLYNEYLEVRKDIALQAYQLQEISTAGQKCEKFGIHHKFPFLKEQYDDNKLAFITNIGSLVEPLTKEEFKNGQKRKCVGLFSHSDQVAAAHTLQCQTAGTSPKGVGGRLADGLKKDFETTSFSIAGTAAWSQGVDTHIEIIDKRQGAVRFQKSEELQYVLGNITTQKHSNAFCEEYTQQIAEAVESSDRLGKYLDKVTLKTDYKSETGLAKQLHQVARLIATRDDRKAERDIFYVNIGGFDAHSEVLEILEEKFTEIDNALRDFVAEIKAQGVFDSTVILSGSDFGRSLTSNGAGTDHAWAGNHFVLGGSVNGGSVLNDFPSSLYENNPQDAGRGRLIPKYPWESMMVPVAEWMGVDSSYRKTIFPNVDNFNATHILSKTKLFTS